MHISVDLEDYEEEIKDSFCNEENCLNKKCFNYGFKTKFIIYIKELENNFLFYGEKKDYETLISDLKYFGSFL